MIEPTTPRPNCPIEGCKNVVVKRYGKNRAFWGKLCNKHLCLKYGLPSSGAQRNKRYPNQQKKDRVRRIIYNQEYTKLVKKRAIEYLGGCCSNPDCVLQCEIPDYALEFHHCDEKKSLRYLNDLFHGGNWPRIVAELQSCKLLCCVCHRLEHFGKSNKSISTKYYRLRKIRAVVYLGGVCSNPECLLPRNLPPSVFDFHHRGGKNGNISDLLKKSDWALIESELDKCDLLCCLCHKIRHAN